MKIALSGGELESTEPMSSLIATAQATRAMAVELWYPKNLPEPERNAAALAKAGLQIACIATGSELYRDGGSSRDQELLLKAISLAHQVGAPFVNTYFGHAHSVDDEAAITTYRRYLEPCLALATERKVTIVLENEFDAFRLDPRGSDISRRPLSLKKLVQAVESPYFRLNFDPSNFYCAGVEPYPYAYELLQPWIAYVHVKDVCRLGPERPLRSGWKAYEDHGNVYGTVPLGTGAVNWSGLIERLVTDGFSGFLTLEPHAEASGREAAWQQAISQLSAWLAEARRRPVQRA